MDEGLLIEEIVVKLAANQFEENDEGIKEKILDDIKKIKKIYYLDAIEDLIESLKTLEEGLESDKEVDSDKDEKKKDEKGAMRINICIYIIFIPVYYY